LKPKITIGTSVALYCALVGAGSFAAPATKPAAKPAAVPAAKVSAKPAAKPKLPKGVVAMVNKTPIMESDILARLWREGGQNVVDRQVNQTIVFLEAKKRNINVTQAQVMTEYNLQKQRFTSSPGRGAGDWDKIVERYGKQNMMDDMKVSVIATKIGESEAAKTKLTAAEIKDAEDTLVKDANQVSAKHILVGIGDQFSNRTEADAQKRMQEVQDKLKAGGKWDDLAKEYSDDLSNKDRGGDLGFFKRGQMVKEFEDTAFSMKPGDITPTPVKTQFGFHLIQVVQVKNDPVTPAAKKEAVAKALETKKAGAKASGTWFTKIKGNYKVQTRLPFE
jgi:parvulin-like peptidyl-prolyl isomerase